MKRVYEPADSEDGYRVLVDRVWPRGVSRDRAAVDEWLRDAGPSDELRKWFGHRPERWPEFVRRYEAEIRDRPEIVDELIERAGPTLTLVYSARDEEHNQAVALAAFLRRRIA
ncbi:MAG: DUF488 family protein [Gemmatimonadota bacterium]|nr:DUF488 family protein [Gemmatimonadota bacterium]